MDQRGREARKIEGRIDLMLNGYAMATKYRISGEMQMEIGREVYVRWRRVDEWDEEEIG